MKGVGLYGNRICVCLGTGDRWTEGDMVRDQSEVDSELSEYRNVDTL